MTIGNTDVMGVNPGPNCPGPFSVPGFDAGRGYDLATGLGTADGARLVAALAGFDRGHRRGR